MIAGAQQGLDLLARCLIDRGDAVIVDRPGYLGALQSFRSAGARMFGWDFARADMDELEDLLLRYRPKLIYTNPTFQNPTGVTLPIRARRELIELAKRYRVPIVEDETYCELSLGPAPPPALERARRRRHGGHSREQLLESARAGAAPRVDRRGAADHRSARADEAAGRSAHAESDAARRVAADRGRHVRSSSHGAPSASIAGGATRVVKALHKHTPTGALRFTVPDGGLFLWCRLAGEVSARDVQQRALNDSVFIVTGEPFYADGGGSRELRLCFSAKPPEVAARAARTIAAAVVAAPRWQPARSH